MKGLLRSLHNHRLHLRWSPSARVTTNTARILDNSQVLRRKHPVLGIKLNRYVSFFNWRDITVIILINSFNNGFRTFRRNHMFSVAMCIMRMRAWWLTFVFCSYDPEPRLFRIFVTSAQLINREFLAFPLGNFFKKSPHFLTAAVPLYCPFLLGDLFFW